MGVEFTDHELELLKRSLKHSVKSGQFFFNIDDTEALKALWKKVNLEQKKAKGND